jgi:GTP-binding protein
VEEPTVRMTFGCEHLPILRQRRALGHLPQITERAVRRIAHNVALRVEETESTDSFLVSGRGELHLANLIETMRREGYEFSSVSTEVIYHKDKDGNLLEPYEEVYIETSADTVARWFEMLENGMAP